MREQDHAARAAIEGQDVVIRIGIGGLPRAAQAAFDDYHGAGAHECRIDDAAAFAPAVVRTLNEPAGDGSTVIGLMLDHAIVRAFEQETERVEGEAEAGTGR